jgi:hypothetical protein
MQILRFEDLMAVIVKAAVFWDIVTCSQSCALMIEAAKHSETSAHVGQAAWCNIPEDFMFSVRLKA